MLEIKRTSAFKKDFKRVKDKKVFVLLADVLEQLVFSKKLDEKYRDHALVGGYSGYRECHLRPDVLFIYKVEAGVLYTYRIGSHSELFKK